jgi:hypothetical protein
MPVSPLYILSILLVCTVAVSHAEPLAVKENSHSVAETIPSTMANLHGQKTLYKEGWFVISSSEKALAYAKEHSIDQSHEAIAKLATSASSRTTDFADDLQKDMVQSGKTIKNVYSSGRNQSKKIFTETHSLAKSQWSLSQESASKAWSRFSNGYIYLSERTAESRKELANLPNDYVNAIADDFSELGDGYQAIHEKSTLDIKANWVNAFDNAQTEFQKAYVSSGEKGNSASGLWTLLGGYAASLWEGLVKPAAKTTWQVTATTVVVAGEVIFLPIATTYILTKNTLQSTGMAIYYSGKAAIEVISPTVEGGFFAGVSLLSAGAIPVTYVAGSSIGVINQMVTTVAAPTAGVAQGVVTATTDTVKYGALLTYDAITATTKVFINQVKSGVVLGYNALTAIPSQLLLTSMNTAYFIVIDGPKLAIASIQGQVHLNQKDQAKPSTFNAGYIPVGSVIDLKALKMQSDVDVNIVTEDPKIINQVIEQLSKDLKQ